MKNTFFIHFLGYKFVLHSHPEFLMDDQSNIQFYMYVHDPRRLGNPISEGITLNSGYKYTMSFKMVRII